MKKKEIKSSYVLGHVVMCLNRLLGPIFVFLGGFGFVNATVLKT